MAVGGKKCDSISVLDAQRGEPAGETRAAIGQLAIRQPACAIDHRKPVAETGAGMIEWVGESDHPVWYS